MKAAILEVFRSRVRPEQLGPIVSSFEDGSIVHTGEDIPSGEYRNLMTQLDGVGQLLTELQVSESPAGIALGHRVRARRPAPHQAPEQGRRRHPRHLPRPRLARGTHSVPSLFPVHFTTTHLIGRQDVHERGGTSRPRGRGEAVRLDSTRGCTTSRDVGAPDRQPPRDRALGGGAPRRLSSRRCARDDAPTSCSPRRSGRRDECAVSHSRPVACYDSKTYRHRWRSTCLHRTRRGKESAGIVVHRTQLELIDRVTVDYIPCTSATRTIIDLAAVLDAEALETAFESGRRLRLTAPDALAKRAAALCGRGRAGTTRVRHLLAVLENRPLESRLEVKVAQLLRSHGLRAHRRISTLVG